MLLAILAVAESRRVQQHVRLVSDPVKADGALAPDLSALAEVNRSSSAVSLVPSSLPAVASRAAASPRGLRGRARMRGAPPAPPRSRRSRSVRPPFTEPPAPRTGEETSAGGSVSAAGPRAAMPSVFGHAQSTAVRSAAPQMLDMQAFGVAAALLAGIGGGIGVIAATENAGVRNEERENTQPCFECNGKRVVDCAICKGEGRDQFASLVKGVQEAVGEEETKSNTVIVDDWAAGPREEEIFGDILDKYPVKVTGPDQCIVCDGRGVIVCDNCEGTGIQPRFLDRYSPDDFMD